MAGGSSRSIRWDPANDPDAGGTAGIRRCPRSVRVTSTLAILSCLGACHPPPVSEKRHEPPVRNEQVSASEPETEAIIEGTVVDATTHEVVEGATVVATPLGSRSNGFKEESSDGFRFVLPPGVYQGRVYVGDAEIPLANVEVKAGGGARWDVELDHGLVARVGDDIEPRCPDAPGQRPASAREVEQLLAAVLERFVQDAESIPDGSTLTDHNVVYVEAEVGDHARVTAGALPRTSPRPFVVKTLPELQAIADGSGTHIPYLSFSSADITGDCATVDLGVYIMPARNSQVSICTCSATHLYVKRDGKWQFKVEARPLCG